MYEFDVNDSLFIPSVCVTSFLRFLFYLLTKILSNGYLV